MTKFLQKLFGPAPSVGPLFEDPTAEAILQHPRYSPCRVCIQGREFVIPDSISFYWAYVEIFIKEAYRFPCANRRPIILDCGANCGLSLSYFKTIFPDCIVDAVEADPAIFELLKQNSKTAGFKGVTLHAKALAASNDLIFFRQEGADSGRVVDSQESGIIAVPGVLLDDLIGRRTVDFLKIDIEGAEVEVLLSSKKLQQVQMLFVEYHSMRCMPQRLHELLDCLRNAGFRYYINVVEGPKRPFEEITDYQGMDLQLNVSCVRV